MKAGGAGGARPHVPVPPAASGGEVPLQSAIGVAICKASECFLRALFDGCSAFEDFLEAAMIEELQIRIAPPPPEIRVIAPGLSNIAAYSGLVRWQPLRCGVCPCPEDAEPDAAWAEYEVTARLVTTGRTYHAKEIFEYAFHGTRLRAVTVWPEWDHLIDVVDEAEMGAQLRAFQTFYESRGSREAGSEPGALLPQLPPQVPPDSVVAPPSNSPSRGDRSPPRGSGNRDAALPPPLAGSPPRTPGSAQRLDGAGAEARAAQCGLQQYGAPCEHNNWRTSRAKRGWIMLRCLNCDLLWKVAKGRPSTPGVPRRGALPRIGFCDSFRRQGGCSLGDECPRLHIQASAAVRARGGYRLPAAPGGQPDTAEHAGAGAERSVPPELLPGGPPSPPGHGAQLAVRAPPPPPTAPRSVAEECGRALPLLDKILAMLAAVETIAAESRSGKRQRDTGPSAPEEVVAARFRRIAAMRSFYPLYRQVDEVGDPRGTRLKLKLYGLYKQACLGDAPAQPPNPDAPADVCAKWAAWRQHNGKKKVDAMREYIDTAADTFPPGVS
eukprot:TRINITY_DN10604_c2_g1_i1.p1 TRINITY_DN10604_c2_g1~~TRINITY_DN10604_c2_g1_i1.p1  ORF type:complete len:575 (+),score=135.74 TRINITY_DN10604_c2_g1_i1:71-1726(+)